MKRRSVEADALRNHAHLEFALGHGAKVWLAQSTMAAMPSAMRSFSRAGRPAEPEGVARYNNMKPGL